MNDVRILNLGCGAHTSPLCINIDWSPTLRLARNPVLRVAAKPFLNARRRDRIHSIEGEVLVHNMRRGIPFASDSVDAVYHSHVLEHIDRGDVTTFQAEIFRILKPGGIQRTCVPDLEILVRRYVSHIDACQIEDGEASTHDNYIASFLEQSVRKEASGTSSQARLIRTLENFMLGDARRRGETHQWMYDYHNLRALLEQSGFTRIRRVDYRTSNIPNWDMIHLDQNEDGTEYKAGSLYVECTKL